jgi:biotin carboxyl carrier protein
MPVEPTPPPNLFRAEAVAHHGREVITDGRVLELSPRWTVWSYRLMMLVLGVAAVYGALGTIPEYASGPAVIRVEGRQHVTARAAGTVASIAVEPGRRVVAGQPLLQLYQANEQAELERVHQEYEQRLLELLRDPNDAAARQALTGLRPQRELAQARVEQRTVRAPVAGTVSDIRVRAGQQVEPGDTLLSLVEPGATCLVVAMLPGHSRPQLHRGMRLRFELDGYRYTYQDVGIEAIGDQLVGPAELRRFLGPELGDTIEAQGPTLLVQARLPANTFSADGQTFHYYDGMRARAEARLRAASLFVTLVPGLRALFERGGG